MTLSLVQVASLAALATAKERGIITPDVATSASAVAASHDAAIFLTDDTGELRVFEHDAPGIGSLPFAAWWATYGAPRAAKLTISAETHHNAA